MKIVRPIIVIAAFAVHFYSQTAVLVDADDFQSWNDVQLTVPMSKHFDFLTKLTLRFGQNISHLSDGRFTIGSVWKPSKSLSISPFYTYINARNAIGSFRKENRLSMAAAYRLPINGFGLTHRSTIERRLRTVNSWRYRAQLTLDKDIPKEIISNAEFFVSDEVFYDSVLDRFSKNRFAVGITKALNHHLALDIYYMRQNDGIARPGDLHIIGTAWKFKL